MTQPQPAARKHSVTSYDVAEHARVSQSTVSRALRGETTVTKETRPRVLNADKALGYQIDARASALRSLKVEFVAVLLVSDPQEHFVEDCGARFALLLQVYEAISALGFEMILSVQNPRNPRNDFIGRRRAQTCIVIGRRPDLAQWAAGVDRASEIPRFNAFDAAAAAWLGDAVQSGATGFEIVLPEATDNAARHQ